MKTIPLRLGERSYSIMVGRNLLGSLGKLLKPLGAGGKVLIVSNRRVAGLFLNEVQSSLKRAGYSLQKPFLLPHGNERDKAAQVLFQLWRHMARAGLERSSKVVALGGGVVGDLAGFAAATYMRGIPFVQVPTTLLAQVDAAIGGKTAVDLPSAKNLVGAFYQPRRVVADVETLRKMGLSPKGLRELRNSFAEIIKYGIIQDRRLFELLEEKVGWFFHSAARKSLGNSELSFLETLVWRSVRVKARVVEGDERETKGRRMILNYGHTFAHAFEAASNYKLPHGEAVALGMACAARMAVRRGIFSEKDEARQNHLVRAAGLPLRPRGIPLKQVLLAMQHDKKKRDGRLCFVLPTAIGRVTVVPAALGEVKKILKEMGGKN